MSVKLTLCLILGIVIGFYFEVSSQFALIWILLLVPVLYLTGKRQPRHGFPFFEVTTTAISIGLGILVIGLATSNDISSGLSEKEGVWHIKIREVLKPNTYSQRYFVKVFSIDGKASSGKLMLNLPADSTGTNYAVDDELFVYDRAETIPPPLNPHQFDYRDFLKKQGVQYQIKTRPEFVVLKNEPSRTLLGIAHQFREHIILKLRQQNFGKEELGVIQALLLGKRDDISEDTYNNYQNAGAVHILAVSGLHVGILLLILEFLLSPIERIRRGKTLKLMLVVGLLWSYAFIAGLSPSIVRAVTMFSFLAYSMYLNRPTNPFNIIALSIFFILLINPLFLFQVGFQMSYAAVLAIVWVYPKLQRFWYPDNFVVRKMWQLLSVSFAAQLGVLPISLFYFHQFPALFFISNLLIIPFLGLILGLGILTIGLSLLNILPPFLVIGYNNIIKLMNMAVAWVANQEGFIIKDIPFDSLQLVLGYFILFGLVMVFLKPKKTSIVMLFTGALLFQGRGLWNQVQLKNTERLVLVHRSRNTILLHQTGEALTILSNDSTNLGNLITDYTIAERIKSISHNNLKNSYSVGDNSLFIMDSLGLLPLEKHPDYVLLTQSPKLNLERFIDSIQPKILLADGSNYKSVVNKWKATCAEKEIPFHYTSEKGFYVFKLYDD